MMTKVVQAILKRGDVTGVVRGHERWGLWFDEPIGYRIDSTGNRLSLFYGELKVSGDRYHAIPRTGPGQ